MARLVPLILLLHPLLTKIAPCGTVPTPERVVTVGDMLVPQDLYELYFNGSQAKNTRKGISLENFLWPKNGDMVTVPYEFQDTRYKDVIKAALNHWEEHTCIKFRPKTYGDTNWLNFIYDVGCWSSIGKMPETGGQAISIGNGCQLLSTVVHEVGHALGLFHEQMRPDRDEYVVINYQNIASDYEFNFMKAEPMLEDNRSVPYDYTSIMHYGGRDFSKNGRNTISTKLPDYQGLLGRTQQLTHRDKHIVNLMYRCVDDWQSKCQWVDCEGEGYVGPSCSCVCPPGSEGERCEIHRADYYDDSMPACSMTISTETTFTSPNYPQNIPEGTWCVYTVKAPANQVPEVVFRSFSLYMNILYNYCEDTLEVRDRSMYEGDVFCNKDIKEDQSFVSKSRFIYLYLETRTSMSKGFQAEVRFHNATNPPNPNSVSTHGPALLHLFLVVLILQTKVYSTSNYW